MLQLVSSWLVWFVPVKHAIVHSFPVLPQLFLIPHFQLHCLASFQLQKKMYLFFVWRQ
jgi:hypothetical protein